MFMNPSRRTHNIHRVHYVLTDSTNTAARRIISEKGEAQGLPLLVTAEGQTEGRGRTGHTFYSPKGTGIYMTLATSPDRDALKKAVFPTTAAAVAVHRVLGDYVKYPEELRIKWVNDLYYLGKKVCGILAESFSYDGRIYVLIGIGLNMTTEIFPEELMCKAGSLDIQNADYSDISLGIAEEYLNITENELDTYMDEYRKFSMVTGKNIDFILNGRDCSGTVASVNDDGSLTVKTPEGETLTISSGEISF